MARVEWLDGLRLRVTFADTYTTVIDVATALHMGGKLHELTHDVERNLPLRIDRKTGKYQGVDTFHYPESGPCFYGVVRKALVNAVDMNAAHSAAVARARTMGCDECGAAHVQAPRTRRGRRPGRDGRGSSATKNAARVPSSSTSVP